MLGKSDDPILVSGRYFTYDELCDVQETIEMFPNLSRSELAKTICENLDWLTPAGKYKVDSASKLLDKLEAEGLVTLPEKKVVAKKPDPVVEVGEKTDEGTELKGSVGEFLPIRLEAARSRESMNLWNEYVQRYHILGYKRPFGAHQRYFIRSDHSDTPLGCMLFSAAAWALARRDKWIGWTDEDRSLRLNWVVNNTRFLVFPWVKVRNLASKALSLAAKQVPLDWQERYGYSPVLLETFVDIYRYYGTCYRAANWRLLGETKGRGRMDRYSKGLSSPKLIFVLPLRKDFREILRGQKPYGETASADQSSPTSSNDLDIT